MKIFLHCIRFYFVVVFSFLLISANGKTVKSKMSMLKHQNGSPEFEKWFQTQIQESPYLYEKAEVNSLKLVQVIFRHGARTPFASYPTDPYANFDYGVKGPGQLLQKGKQQGLALGTYLRKRYDGFLTSEYSSEEVYAQSSDVDRTILTTEMVLAGLFPAKSSGGYRKKFVSSQPLNWQPIPLRTIPMAIDNKLLGDVPCPRYAKTYRIYSKGVEFKMIQENNRPVYEYVERQTGIDKNDFNKMVGLADTLYVQALNGLKLPNWTEPVFPTRLNRIHDIILTANTSTPKLSRFTVGPILAQLVQNMEMAIDEAPSSSWTKEDLRFYHFRAAKVYLFGGHDTTIAPILNAFHVYDGDQPPYTSALIFELHAVAGKTNSSNAQSYTVKMLYKKVTHQQIIALKLTECAEPCTFPDFKAKYKQLIVGDGQWVQECRFKSIGS